MKSIWIKALGLGLATFTVLCAAQDAYPSRAIRLVVGFPPGGGGDGVARIMGEHMSRTLRQPVIVENRPGAGTTLAPAFVSAAPPDGYTLLLTPDSVFGADKAIYQPNVKYDETSFTPISKWVSTFFVMAANKNFGVNNLTELKAKAATMNGKVFTASTQGPYPAMIFENFNRLAGFKLEMVPFKGGAPAVMATVGGEVPLTFSVPSSIMPMVKEGKLVAIATTAPRRSALAEGVPTLAEEGLKGFDVGYWFGLAGPAGLPADVAQKLFDASAKALADPEVQKRLNTLGYELAPSKSLAEFRTQALEEGAQLRKTVERLGIRGN
jgi:tripartite-type tricarboxylate transporter receptor subunit TctC